MELYRNRLAQVQLVPLTPFTPDGGRVVPEVLQTFTRQLFEAGVRVFLPGAGTGEFYSLSAAEVVQCVHATKQAVGDAAVVVAPIGMSVRHAVEVGRGAIEAGADALLVMPPIHPYLCDAGLRDYFRTLMSVLPKPFLAYKKGPFPSNELLLELGQSGQLMGIKYAVNDLNEFALFADAVAGRLELYCGTAERWAPYFMLAGAKAFTSGAGNLCPRLTLALFRALSAGDFREGMRILHILRPIEDFRARAGDSFNISMLKFGVQALGHDFGPPRPPMRQLTDAEQAEVRALLEPILDAERKLH